MCNCVVLATNQAVAATAIHLEDGSGVVGDANAIFDQVGNRLLPALGDRIIMNGTDQDHQLLTHYLSIISKMFSILT